MKNLFILFILFQFAFVSSLSAQCFSDNIIVKKGDVDINVGVGLVPTFISNTTTTEVLPLSLSVAYRFHDNISVGVYSAFSSTNYKPESRFDEVQDKYLTNDFLMTGIRLQGHFDRDCFGFYGGAMLGYTVSFIHTNYEKDEQLPEGLMADDHRPDAIIYSGYLGFRYMLKKHLGVFGEIGYGASLVNLGVATRF